MAGLIKQILSPLIIRAADHSHDVPAGVERKGPGLLQELHIGLTQQMVAFAAIAGMAAGHQVLPRR